MADTLPPTRGPAPEDLTRLLAESASGSASARDRLLQTIYDDLHSMARARMRGERRDHTLSATALVAEAYMRLFRATGQTEAHSFEFANRRGFFTAAATTMRRILIDYARSRASEKRGGGRPTGERRVPLDVLEAAANLEPHEILALDDATLRLEMVDERAATVVRLRFYGGLEIADVAAMMEISERTIKRDWEFARAWLRDAMANEDDTDEHARGAHGEE